MDAFINPTFSEERCENEHWYHSETDAKNVLQAVGSARNVAFVFSRKKKRSTDVSKGKIFWSLDGFPYITVVTNMYIGKSITDTSIEEIPKAEKMECNKSENCASATVVQALRFPQYKASDSNNNYFRRKSAKLIKKSLLNDSSLAKEIKYHVTFSNIKTSLDELELNNVEDDEIDTRPVKWTTSFSNAMQDVRDFEIETCSKFISVHNYKPHDMLKTPLEWDETFTPYKVVVQHKMECHLGKDRNKFKNQNRRENMVPFQLLDHDVQAKRLLLQSSKKVDCKATLTIKEVVKFPQYKINKMDATLLFEAEAALQNSIASNEQALMKESAWCTKFPLEKDHAGHAVGEAAGILQPIDPRIVSKITELVRDGVCNIRELERSVRRYVKHELFGESCPPDVSNRRFHPSSADIRNHFNLAFANCKLAKRDQENVSQLVEQWKSANPSDKILFRFYIAGSTTSKPAGSEDQVSRKHTLLFVHQMAWQQRLLMRYGQDICLLDATYKTSKYALPLFLLCVKANVSYIVVASFVIQNETHIDIQEALQVLKLWNPQWKPSFFVTDNCEAEINAIERTFEECRVLICDFHREQAWERWVKKSDNAVGESRGLLLNLMRAVAKAETETEYKEVLENLQQSNIWKSNARLRSYFNNIWLSQRERWLQIYRVDKLPVCIRTNNGVERQNRVLKQCHIRLRTDKSLSGLVTVLHKEFMPEAWLRYQQENTKASESYKPYSDFIPVYLRNRPKPLVKHCMERFLNSADIEANMIERNGDTFTVKSATTDQTYCVLLSNERNYPACNCMDFRIHFLPCKHIFAIIDNYNDVSWESLPAWYRNSPHRVLDHDVIFTNFKGPGTVSKTHMTTTDCSEQTLPNHVNVKSGKVSSNPNPIEAGNKKKEIDYISSVVSEIRNVSFDVASVTALKEAGTSLKKVLEDLLQSCDHDAGLRVSVKPAKKPLKLKRRRKDHECDDLPRKYPKVNPYASRHGAVADIMRPLHSVATIAPSISSKYDCKIKTVAKKVSGIMTQESKNDSSSEETIHCTAVTSPNITPPVTICKHCKITDALLQNGPHAVSMVQLKSLETILSRNELQLLTAHDKQFSKGWLYDEVINSYLWQICKQHDNCLYVCSSIALVLQKRGSIKRLWNGKDLSNKKYIFIPWNPSGMHWIMLAVDIEKRKLLYLDPMERPCLTTSITVKTATELVNYLLQIKLNCHIQCVEAPTRTMQKDMESCGIFVCMYAKYLAGERDLCQLRSFPLTSYRKEIFDVIAGDCLKVKIFNRKECRVCRRFEIKDCITCIRCKQTYHLECLNLCGEAEIVYDNFTCS